MYDTCIALVLDECPDAVLDERFGGVGVLQVLPGLKDDELQNMLFWLWGGQESFLPDWKARHGCSQGLPGTAAPALGLSHQQTRRWWETIEETKSKACHWSEAFAVL